MGRLKKAGITGKYGTRYGSTLRKATRLILEKEKGNIKCPKCVTNGSINRISTGIWHCKKCGAKFSGGAYFIETPRGAESFRIAKRKQRESELLEE